MRRGAAFFAILLLSASCAFADTLVLKSGEKKQGKILEDDNKRILFKQTDGMVVEVPRSTISIVDHEWTNADLKKHGFLSLFSTPPPSKKKHQFLVVGDSVGPPEHQEPGQQLNQAASFGKFETFIERWLKEHPAFTKHLEETIQKFKGKEADMDELVKAAKQQ